VQTYIFVVLIQTKFLKMKKITTIILDLGGVILNLDQDKTLRNFKRLGLDLEDINIDSDLFKDFEKGLLNEEDFRQTIKTKLKGNISDEQIDEAWNSMLLDVPAERLDIIKQLKQNFNIYLLSNTNAIHINYFINYFAQNHGNEDWNNLFDKIFYSYEIGLRKPDAEFFDFVLKNIGSHASECIFIDDSKLNIKAAENSGIHTIWAKEPLSTQTLEEIKNITAAIRVSLN
jgi:putative hydrolase of the HAD superfamily